MRVNYKVKQGLIRACQILYQQGYLTGMDGNLSIRLENDTVLSPLPPVVIKGFDL